MRRQTQVDKQCSLVPSSCQLKWNCYRFSNGVTYNNRLRYKNYDYVVVGAGSAGSVVANRLSENGKFTVLLLEAGGTPPFISEVPMLMTQLSKEPMEWNNVSEVQENACQGRAQGRCVWSRAKVLGGSSTHNGMCFVRGNKQDFDNWELFGATGWNYKNVLKTYKDIENHTDPTIRKNGYHGTEGLQTVSTIPYKSKVLESYFEAARSLGYKMVDDYNGASQLGFGYVQLTQRDGLRCGTEKAFLRPIAQRDNLDILINAFVMNISIDDKKTVKSVFFEHKNEIKEIPVKEEVIVSAGTISTPLILMRSGIGPKEHLEEMKIPVIVDLPVGQNFQDHPFCSHLNYYINDSVGVVLNRDFNPDNMRELFEKSGGPMTSPAFIEGAAFINSDLQKKNDELPDLMLFLGSSALFPPMNDDFSDSNATGVLIMLSRPESRGVVKLRSKDPYDDPVVEPRYFTDSGNEDVKRLVSGVKKVEELVKTPFLQRYNPQLQPKVLPACKGMDTESDEYIECAVRKYVTAGFHMGGTCKMGRPNNPTTVVDPELRVKSVKGLRVADASVMPTLPTCNPNAPCIMIGRRAADMILSAP